MERSSDAGLANESRCSSRGAEPGVRPEDPAAIDRAAATILLLRGTGLACAGLLAGAKLFAEGDAMRWRTLPPLGAGVVLALLSLVTMRAAWGTNARRLAIAGATPIVLAWVLLNLWQAWQIRDEPIWLLPLPANFLPDVYALWTLSRARGRLFLARTMVVLAALSSLAVSWFGAALILA